jgi:hypothetical protein
MSLPNNETFIETSKNRLTSWQTRVTIEYGAATVSDLDQKARWFKEVGQFVTAVRRVKITRQDVTFSNGNPVSDEGFEVDFECGAKGWICERRDWAELDALVVGTKGYLHGLAVWRKRGHIVGSPCPWFRAQKSARSRQNPNSAPRTCAAELYVRAAGKVWPPVRPS